MSDSDFFTDEADGKVGTIHTVEQARAAHHLATADPEVDGPLNGPEHEAKYGLARAKASAAYWRARHADDTGPAGFETADAAAVPEAAVPPVAAPVVETSTPTAAA